MNVLVAIDGSPEATTALETASRMLTNRDRHLDILCVAPKLRGNNWDRARQNAYDRRILREIAHIMEPKRLSLSRNGGVAELLTEIGSPPRVIVHKTGDYDLTVIGPKGRGTIGEVGLGPVASRVVEHALGPVLVARDLRSDGGLRVLIAVDGSTASLHAIKTLCEFFDLTSAEICVMHVTETPWVELGLDEDWVTYSDEDKERSEAGVMEAELTREGNVLLDQAREMLLPYAVSVNSRTEEGNPANEILSEAERGQYDLVVVGATGARDLKHRMLGSVSSKVAWNAPCSVLIVREAE